MDRWKSLISVGTRTRRLIRNAATIALPMVFLASCSLISSDSTAYKGVLRSREGLSLEYSVSWGTPTVKADGCTSSPPVGRVNLPFTVTVKNLDGQRTIPMQRVAYLEAGVNIPRGQSGLIQNIDTAFSTDSASIESTDLSCNNDVCGLGSTQVLKPNGTCQTKMIIANVPENIPNGTNLYLRVVYGSNSGWVDCRELITIPYPSGELAKTSLGGTEC
jgi:hypothetical protein